MRLFKIIQFLEKISMRFFAILLAIYLTLLFLTFLVADIFAEVESILIQTTNFIEIIMIIAFSIILSLYIFEACIRIKKNDSILNMFHSRLLTKLIRKNFIVKTGEDDAKEKYNELINKSHVLITNEEAIFEVSAKTHHEALGILEEKLPIIKKELSNECQLYIFSEEVRDRNKYIITGSRKY